MLHEADDGLYQLVKELEAITMSTNNSPCNSLENEVIAEKPFGAFRDLQVSLLRSTEKWKTLAGYRLAETDFRQLAAKVARLTSEKHQLQRLLNGITEDRTRTLILCLQIVEKCHQHFKQCSIVEETKNSKKKYRDHSTQTDFVEELQRSKIIELEKKIDKLKEEKKEGERKILLLKQMIKELESKFVKTKNEVEHYRWNTKKGLTERLKHNAFELAKRMTPTITQEYTARKTAGVNIGEARQNEYSFDTTPQLVQQEESVRPKNQPMHSRGGARSKSTRNCREPETYELLFKLRFLQKTIDGKGEEDT